MAGVDMIALGKFRESEQQQLINQLRSEINGRRVMALVDVVNGMGSIADAVNAGDENAKKLAQAFVENFSLIRAAAESKIVVPPGTKRAAAAVDPLDQLTEQQKVAGQ